jgi:hypothetical protein
MMVLNNCRRLSEQHAYQGLERVDLGDTHVKCASLKALEQVQPACQVSVVTKAACCHLQLAESLLKFSLLESASGLRRPHGGIL